VINIDFSKLSIGDKVLVACSHRKVPNVVTTIKRISPKNGLITLNDIYANNRYYNFDKHFDKYGSEKSNLYYYKIIDIAK